MVAKTTDPGKCAIPTLYNGTQFRSRLEATWAAFFDLVKWQWRYEPRDLDGYIPDFFLRFKETILAEVKPSTTCETLRSAAGKIESSGWTGDYILLGDGFLWEQEQTWAHQILGLVTQTEADTPRCRPGACALGMSPKACASMCQGDTPSRHASLDRALFHRCYHCGSFSFHHESGGWKCYVNGCYDGNAYLGAVETEEAEALWRAASNRVQWKGPVAIL